MYGINLGHKRHTHIEEFQHVGNGDRARSCLSPNFMLHMYFLQPKIVVL